MNRRSNIVLIACVLLVGFLGAPGSQAVPEISLGFEVLVVDAGEPDPQWAAMFQDAGATSVTYRADIPSDLRPYEVVWLRSYAAATTGAVAGLQAYVTQGGGLLIEAGVPYYLCASYDLSCLGWFGAGISYVNVGAGETGTIALDGVFGTTLHHGDTLWVAAGAGGARVALGPDPKPVKVVASNAGSSIAGGVVVDTDGGRVAFMATLSISASETNDANMHEFGAGLVAWLADSSCSTGVETEADVVACLHSALRSLETNLGTEVSLRLAELKGAVEMTQADVGDLTGLVGTNALAVAEQLEEVWNALEQTKAGLAVQEQNLGYLAAAHQTRALTVTLELPPATQATRNGPAFALVTLDGVPVTGAAVTANVGGTVRPAQEGTMPGVYVFHLQANPFTPIQNAQATPLLVRATLGPNEGATLGLLGT